MEVHKLQIAWSKEGTAGEGLILHCLHHLLAMVGDGTLGSGILAHVAFCFQTDQVPALLSLLTLIKKKKQTPKATKTQPKREEGEEAAPALHTLLVGSLVVVLFSLEWTLCWKWQEAMNHKNKIILTLVLSKENKDGSAISSIIYVSTK